MRRLGGSLQASGETSAANCNDSGPSQTWLAPRRDVNFKVSSKPESSTWINLTLNRMNALSAPFSTQR